MKSIKSFDNLQKLTEGTQLKYRYPKSKYDSSWREATLYFDKSCVNKVRFRLNNHVIDSEGIWEGQIENGNVEVELLQ